MMVTVCCQRRGHRLLFGGCLGVGGPSRFLRLGARLAQHDRALGSPPRGSTEQGKADKVTRTGRAARPAPASPNGRRNRRAGGAAASCPSAQIVGRFCHESPRITAGEIPRQGQPRRFRGISGS